MKGRIAMAKDHHDYSLDKDTPESIRQLTEQDSDPAPVSQHGLPAGDRLDNYRDPDDPFLTFDEDPGQSAIEVPIHGKGADRPLPTEFHSNKGRRR